MSVSLEALAMAGIDSNECAMDAEEWERNEAENDVPLHLLADEDEEEDNDVVTSTASNYKSPATGLLGSWRRKDGRADGVHCIISGDIMCNYFSRTIEKRGSNGLSSSGRIMVRTIVGFLTVMTMKIISAQRSKF